MGSRDQNNLQFLLNDSSLFREIRKITRKIFYIIITYFLVFGITGSAFAESKSDLNQVKKEYETYEKKTTNTYEMYRQKTVKSYETYRDKENRLLFKNLLAKRAKILQIWTGY